MSDAASMALLVAVGLGLRHALDPDHLVAVAGLGASGDAGDRRQLLTTGLAWGAGHAISLVLAGLAVIMLGWQWQETTQQGWERIVGIAIALIGVRLLLLRFIPASRANGIARAGLLPAIGIGMVHGLAGTGGVTLMLLPIVPQGAQVPALLVFAAMTCISMGLCMAIAGQLLSAAVDRFMSWRAVRVVVGVSSVVFGVGYAAAV